MTNPVPPVLRDLPPIIETERLVLRAPRAGDGETIYNAIVESLTELLPYMDWAHGEQSIDRSEEFARRASAHWVTRDDLPMLIFHKTDGHFIGSSGLHTIHWEIPKFEIGYWIRTRESGHGYMTEAVLGLTKFCFETLEAERVQIRCDALNQRSAGVARRAGYVYEGCTRRDTRTPYGELRDTLTFSLIREEYFTLKLASKP